MNFVSSRLWTIDHRAFEEICGSGECASADGFLLESGTADSFGMRYVEEGFDWIEARDIGRRDGWVRFEKDTQGRITSKSIDRPIAAYSVVESYEHPPTCRLRPYWNAAAASSWPPQAAPPSTEVAQNGLSALGASIRVSALRRHRSRSETIITSPATRCDDRSRGGRRPTRSARSLSFVDRNANGQR